MLERPALRRFIEPLPTRLPDSDERMFALRDPFKLAKGSVVLSGAGIALLSLLDGTRTLPEVLDECARQFHFRPTLEILEGLVATLNDACLLEGPALTELVQSFTASTVRPPACIGSYPGDPSELRQFLEDQYSRDGGPGRPPGERNGDPRIRAIISPHIDMHRGGYAYAWPWREVATSCDADLFVIFGTSHMGTASVHSPGQASAPLYALTRKPFETPIGTVPTDVEAVDRLVAAYAGPEDLFAGEFHHRSEHSIEFQVVYLAHLFAGQRPIRILPVLCGGLHDLAGSPTEDPRFSAFHHALREALAPIPSERIAFVAGIDLAHVGVQFHEAPVSAADLIPVEEADRRTLAIAIEDRCPDTLHTDITEGGDWRNICGHSALVGFLEAMRGEPLSGELLCYTRWHDGESAVSFAGAVYRENQE